MAEALTAEDRVRRALDEFEAEGVTNEAIEDVREVLATLDAARAELSEARQALIREGMERDAARAERDVAEATREAATGTLDAARDEAMKMAAKYDRLVTIAANLAPELAALRALADEVAYDRARK